jgi:hypothetical protein
MKSSFFRGLVCASILVFAIGCGKENKSGSGSPNYGGFNPIINPGTNVDQNALNNLRAWYQNAESQNIGNRGDFLKGSGAGSTPSTGFSFSWCFNGQGSGCAQQQQASNCYVRNGNGVDYDIGTPSTNINMPCTITQAAVSKGNNVELQKAVNGNGLSLLEIRQNGTQFTLIYGQQYAPQVGYVIDTSLHSIFNPIVVQTPSSMTIFRGFRIIN